MERVPQAPGWAARGPGGPGAWGARRGLGAWAGPGGMSGAPGGLGGMGGAAGGHGRGARGATHSHHAVARGGNCTIRATTRRRHAVKQLLMPQNPPAGPSCRHHTDQRAQQEPNSPATGTWERLQRPRPRQLNHHERSLGSAVPPAAPASDVPTRRVTGPRRS